MAASASKDLNKAEDRLMLEKGIDKRPHRWYATRKSTPAPDAEDDSDSWYILSEDPDYAPQCDSNAPFATAVLFGLLPAANDVPKSLHPKATEWHPTPRDQKTKMTLNKIPQTNTADKSKNRNMPNPQNDVNVGSQTPSIVLPAFCSPPLRNGGYTFFANGQNHQDFCPGDNRNHESALLFLDKVPLAKIYSQISTKTKQLQDLAARGDQGQ
jgi:hypothetical protein